MVELVGYLASVLVVASLAMTSVVRLRTISLVGSLVFVVYGALIGSVPIVITNGAIAALNVWFLRAELGGRRKLAATPIAVDAPFLTDFLTHHLADIHRFQPAFTVPEEQENVVVLLLMRDGLPAGALMGRERGAELEVVLDYVTKPYRDSQISQWLYGRGAGVFHRLGVERLVSAPGTDVHTSYLVRSGFRRVDDRFVLELGS